MTQASVGFHCPECVRSGSQRVIRGRELTARRPPVTVTLIAVNVAVFFLDRAILIDGLTLRQRGFLFGPLVQTGEWWRVVTAGFLHADLLHLGFNMFLLWILGQNLERLLGSARFAVIYLAGLLGGSLAATLFDFSSGGLGASGAVLGIAGALVAVLWSSGRSIRETPLGGLLLLNLALPLLSPQISFWAHAGGALGGFVAGWLLLNLPGRLRNTDNAGVAVVSGLCALLLAASVLGPVALGY